MRRRLATATPGGALRLGGAESTNASRATSGSGAARSSTSTPQTRSWPAAGAPTATASSAATAATPSASSTARFPTASRSGKKFCARRASSTGRTDERAEPRPETRGTCCDLGPFEVQRLAPTHKNARYSAVRRRKLRFARMGRPKCAAWSAQHPPEKGDSPLLERAIGIVRRLYGVPASMSVRVSVLVNV